MAIDASSKMNFSEGRAGINSLSGGFTETLSVRRCKKRYTHLTYVKVGRSVKYSREAVDAFIAERTA